MQYLSGFLLCLSSLSLTSVIALPSPAPPAAGVPKEIVPAENLVAQIAAQGHKTTAEAVSVAILPLVP